MDHIMGMMKKSLFSAMTWASVALFFSCSVGANYASASEPTSTSMVSYEKANMVAGIEFRWLNNAGFEMILPNGKHVLIDPWLDSADMFPLSVAKDIKRADYIVLSHIHFDHAQDVKLIQDKFPNVRIIVGAQSGPLLQKWQNLNTNKMYPAIPGQKFEFDDCTIQVFASRHTEGARGNFPNFDQYGNVVPQWFGGQEMLNFLITASDGTKVMVWGGMPSDDQVNSLRGTNPDIAVMHVSPKQDFSMFGKLVGSMNAKVVIPHHYDIWESLFKAHPELKNDSPLPPEQVTVENILGLFRKSIVEGSPQTYFFVAEHHKWYHFGLGFAESK